MIALTKTLDPKDYEDAELQEPLGHVDKHFTPDQHSHRRWEYAMALAAYVKWEQGWDVLEKLAPTVLDVGGFGSPFQEIAAEIMRQPILVDPKENSDIVGYMGSPVDVIFSISTFEHVQRPLAFLDAIDRLLCPSGLLFMTFDFAPDRFDTEQPDDHYHFHWMRERIMGAESVSRMRHTLSTFCGIEPFGGSDYTDHGPQVYDYTFASLALRKKDA